MCFFRKKKNVVVVEKQPAKPAEKEQPKAQPQPAAKEQPKAQPQPATKEQPKAQPQPAAKEQPKAQPQPATKEQPKAQPQPAAKEQPKAQPQPAVKEQPKAQPQPAAKEQPKTAETDNKNADDKKAAVNKNYHVSLREDGMWQVKFAKGEKALKLFKTQAEAIEFAKEKAANQDGSITIHKKDGKIRKQKY